MCISQEGFKSLIKCAEILQVKGLWRNDNLENTTILPTSTITEKTTDVENFADMIIKTENNFGNFLLYIFFQFIFLISQEIFFKQMIQKIMRLTILCNQWKKLKVDSN